MATGIGGGPFCGVEMFQKGIICLAYTLELGCGFFIPWVFIGMRFESKLETYDQLEFAIVIHE